MSKYDTKKQLIELNMECEVFSFIIKEDFLSWSDIIDEMAYFKEHSLKFKKPLRKDFFAPESMHTLESMGINYNFRDNRGDDFSKFLIKSKDTDKNHQFYPNFLLEYILEKTKDVYSLNSCNENLLFYLLSSNANVKLFFETIKKYPNFDFHQISTKGENLFNIAIKADQHPEIFDFLTYKGLSVDHLDKDKNNLLNLFSLVHCEPKNEQLFSTLLKRLDISNKNKWGDTCLKNWISFLKNAPDDHYGVEWIYYLSEKILANQTPEHCLKPLVEIFNDNKPSILKERFELKSTYLKACAYLNKKVLELELSPKSSKQKSVKI